MPTFVTRDKDKEEEEQNAPNAAPQQQTPQQAPPQGMAPPSGMPPSASLPPAPSTPPALPGRTGRGTQDALDVMNNDTGSNNGPPPTGTGSTSESLDPRMDAYKNLGIDPSVANFQELKNNPNINVPGTAGAPMNPPSMDIPTVTRDYDDGEGDPDNNWQDQWQQIWEDHNQSGEAAQKGTYMDEARAGRGMSAMNAMTGGSLGGAFAGGMGQVGAAGMRSRLKAQQEHSKQGLELRMSYLDRLYSDAEREDNQEMMEWVENQRNETALGVAGLQASGVADVEDSQDQANIDDRENTYLHDNDMMPDSEKALYWEDQASAAGMDPDRASEVGDLLQSFTYQIPGGQINYLTEEEKEYLVNYFAENPDYDLNDFTSYHSANGKNYPRRDK